MNILCALPTYLEIHTFGNKDGGFNCISFGKINLLIHYVPKGHIATLESLIECIIMLVNIAGKPTSINLESQRDQKSHVELSR